MDTLPDVSRLSFDAKKHAYKLDDKLMSGVTTVLNGTSDKAQLINWSAKVAVEYVRANSEAKELGDASVPDFWLVSDKILYEAETAHTRKKEAAGARGTDVHGLVEAWINICIDHNGGKPMNKETTHIQPFVDWAHGEVKRFIASEQRLFDEDNAVAGTADFFYISMEDELVTGDLKTFPKMWSPDAYCQTGIYARMWRLSTGNQATKSVIVKMCDPEDERLKKYGGKAFAVYERFALEEDEDMFLKRLAVYRYNQNFKSPTE